MKTEIQTEIQAQTQTQSNQLAISKSILAQADDLVLEHESLGTHIAIGRIKFYELLGKVYALSEQLEASTDKKELVKGMRWDLLKRHKIKTQRTSSATSVLIRYITRADRKNVHVYARAIEAAKSHGVAVQDFPAFLQEQGGIEKIRAASCEKNLITSEEEAIAIVKNLFLARAELPYAQFELSKGLHEFGAGCTFDYFVAINTGGNQYSAVAKIDADHVFEQKALKSFASMLDLQDSEAKEKLLKFIEYGRERREARIKANEGKIGSEKKHLRGEIPEVKQEQFETLFETNQGKYDEKSDY